MSAKHALGTACLAAAAIAAFGFAAAAARRSREGDEAAQAERAVLMRLRQLDHDLRTPLGTVHAALDILRSTADRDGALRNETLALMDRQVARLRSLVQSLHELTRDMEGEVGSKPGP
jgi:K+-sensing histidine kinase KdpD